MKLTKDIGTPSGLKVPHSNDILWDNTLPWNKDLGDKYGPQYQRNFHEEPSDKNGGYTLATNDFSVFKKNAANYDGIQRYKIGSINYKTEAASEHSEGIWQAWQELYNLGEIKPPIGLGRLPISTKDKTAGNELISGIEQSADKVVDATSNFVPNSFYSFQESDNDKLSVDYSKDGTNFIYLDYDGHEKPKSTASGIYDIYSNCYGSFERSTNSNFQTSGKILQIPKLIYTNSDKKPVKRYRLGSGMYPGNKSNPVIENSMGMYNMYGSNNEIYDITTGSVINAKGIPTLTYRVNILYNGLCARISKLDMGKTQTLTPQNFLGYSSSKDGKIYGQSPALTDIFLMETGIGGVAPLDGRGFKVNENVYYPCARKNLNSTKRTDGYYLPLIQGDTIKSGKIDVSKFYNDYSLVQQTKWGDNNSTAPGYGPQEAIATFSFEYMGSALVDDPQYAGPSFNGSIPLPKNTHPPFNPSTSDGPDPILDKDSLAFTLRGRSFTTYLFDIMNKYTLSGGVPDYINDFNPWKGGWKTKMTVKNEFLTSPNIAIKNGVKGWLYPETAKLGPIINNTASGWASSATAIGGEANILSCLQTKNGNFTPMKHFLIAAAITMGGTEYASKTKVGLYSFEFMPLTWMGRDN